MHSNDRRSYVQTTRCNVNKVAHYFNNSSKSADRDFNTIPMQRYANCQVNNVEIPGQTSNATGIIPKDTRVTFKARKVNWSKPNDLLFDEARGQDFSINQPKRYSCTP